jgi:hypothetical protein
MKHRSTSPNVTKNLPMAGFELTLYGRFWVTPEALRPASIDYVVTAGVRGDARTPVRFRGAISN